jgi:hypothetical protein
VNYDEAVTKAAKALKVGEDANWTLARLTYENTAKQNGGRPVKAATAAASFNKLATLRTWSADVRAASGRSFSYQTAGLYRQIWGEHGTTYLAGEIDWRTAYEQVRGQSADERMGNFNLQRGLDNATVEARREAFINLAQDEEVLADKPTVQRVDRHVRPIANLAEAERRDAQRQGEEQAIEGLIQREPTFKKVDEAGALLDLNRALRHFFDEATPILSRLPENATPGEGHTFLRFEFDRAEGVMNAIRAFLDEGQTDLDKFLNTTLKG